MLDFLFFFFVFSFSFVFVQNIYFASYTRHPEVCIMTGGLPPGFTASVSISTAWSWELGRHASTGRTSGRGRAQGRGGLQSFRKEKAVEHSDSLKTSANIFQNKLLNRFLSHSKKSYFYWDCVKIDRLSLKKNNTFTTLNLPIQ